MFFYRKWLVSSCNYQFKRLYCNPVKYRLKDILKDVAPATNIMVNGWIKSIRNQKDVSFININDGSSSQNLQLVCAPSLVLADLTFGSCIEANGSIQESKGKGQTLELLVKDLRLIGSCDLKTYPFQPRHKYDNDYIRKFIHLRSKTMSFSALLRFRNALTHAIHSFFQSNEFIQIHTPIITSNDCEGAGETFSINVLQASKENGGVNFENSKGRVSSECTKHHFFDNPVFLTVSGQLHLEALMGAFTNVYTFGPTFRAENSRGRHHLSEFYMVEAEMAFTSQIYDVTIIMEKLIKYITNYVLTHNSEDLHYILNSNSKNLNVGNHKLMIENILKKDFITMNYSEAVDILQQSNHSFNFSPQWGCDFQKEHEHYLVKHCNGTPVFVIDYPEKIKPFYVKSNNDSTASAVDLLCVGVGELCGGSIREDNHDILQSKVNSLQISDKLDWYLDLRKFGFAPHGGFGMGFERLIMLFCGLQNIKDTIPYPRFTHNCKM